MISTHELTKTFGTIRAVDGLTFDVAPGRVTAFLGRNGSGKTTTMRMLLGLADPTSGTATFGGKRYADLRDPARQVGAAISSDAFHPGRTAAAHLRIVATAAGIDPRRVDEVRGQVGLTDAAGRRVGGYSLGMRQRLTLANALLGDPGTLVLDEPINGLDPDGIVWLRAFLRHLASEGRTVFLSSHVLTEVAQSVDDVIVIERGQLVAAKPLAGLGTSGATVVRTPDAAALISVLGTQGISARRTANDQVEVPDVDSDVIGRLAAHEGVVILELTYHHDDLETVFHQLTHAQEVSACNA